LAALASFYQAGCQSEGVYYRDNLLAQKLLPHMCRLAQDEFFMFEQDSTPLGIKHATPSLFWRDTGLHSSNTVATEFAGP